MLLTLGFPAQQLPVKISRLVTDIPGIHLYLVTIGYIIMQISIVSMVVGFFCTKVLNLVHQLKELEQFLVACDL